MSQRASVVASSPAQQPRAAGRIAALDGLRGLAVACVMLYHTGSSPLAGGYLGVDIFFVLSGFLIASILLREYEARRAIRLGTFWLRRARRLAPALLLLTLVLAVQRALSAPGEGVATRAELLAGLTYTTNWFQIVTGSDYFAQFSAPSPLLHLWSLAIEEQFYLLLAPLLLLVLPRMRSTRRLVHLLTALVLLSAISMWVADATGHPTWAYYATTARMQALMVGCLLAVIIRSKPPGPQRWRTPVGALCVVGLLVFMVQPPVPMFRGGFLLVAALTAVLIWSVLGAGPVSRGFGVRPLAGLGLISYGVYLWHWPIFLWLRTHRPEAGLGQQVWAACLTIVVALFSYVLVEKPIRAGRFSGLPARKQWLTYAVTAVAVGAFTLLPPGGSSGLDEGSWPHSSQIPQSITASGDSTILVLNEGFPTDRYPDVDVIGVSKIGCGFMTVPRWRAGVAEARPECLDWRAQWQDVGARNGSQAAVIGSPVWDTFDRVVDEQRSAPGQPFFDGAYTEALRAAVDIAGQSGQLPVYVLGMPCFAATQDADILNSPQRRTTVNQLTQSALEGLPQVHYIDLTDLTCDAGEAISESSARRLYRDGVHWSVGGAAEVWRIVLGRMAADRPLASPAVTPSP